MCPENCKIRPMKPAWIKDQENNDRNVGKLKCYVFSLCFWFAGGNLCFWKWTKGFIVVTCKPLDITTASIIVLIYFIFTCFGWRSPLLVAYECDKIQDWILVNHYFCYEHFLLLANNIRALNTFLLKPWCDTFLSLIADNLWYIYLCVGRVMLVE
jgi:hypothetical protein